MSCSIYVKKCGCRIYINVHAFVSPDVLGKAEGSKLLTRFRNQTVSDSS